jgi:hypothetical protein
MRFNRHFRFSAMSELTEASHRAAARASMRQRRARG